MAKGRGLAGVGSDFIENAVLKGAPECVQRDYLDMLHGVQQQCRWPRQAYLNMVALIGKGSGGERAVGLMCGMYRTYCACVMRTIADRRESQTRHWDDAVRGSSPLQAALRRTVYAEAEAAQGRHVAMAFGDY